MVRWASISGDDTYYNFFKGVGQELEWNLAERIYNADDQVAGYITDEGILGYVQPVGAALGNAWPDKTEVYGTGAFLAAGAEVCTLVERSPE
jgi:hypothetical protein